MTQAHQLQLSFDGVELGQSNRLAESLRQAVERDVDGCSARIARNAPGTMDFGSTLILVLGTSAVTVLAKGVADWLAARPEATLTITDHKRGKLVATGVRAKDIVQILAAWKESSDA